MKRIAIAALLGSSFFFATAASAKGDCKWKDMAKAKTHVESHITFPATGKDVKEACKKEMPEEFTKEEHACIDSKIKDDAQFKTAADLEKVLSIK